MTVLHSRNADAADPVDVADAADVKDPQDAAAETDLREDLGRYAELGAFTLTADTHAWYAAVDTVATPEDARAASTALAELRGRDLQQTWEAVTALATEVKLDEPDTVAKTALLVEMLQRVHRTSATLTTAAYDADLGALAAATADSAWRRENGVKLSWLRGRSLRKQATALATDRRVRREDLHEALTSAEIERRAWAALAPAGTLPVAPADGALVERTAQAVEAIGTGLRELARLLPDHDLDGLPFAELIDLVERLAADEGTLYRLPTIGGLRATLEEAGLGDLLAELATAKADRRAAEAAYSARQALASGQRDGLAGQTAVEEPVTEEPEVEASEVEASDVETSDVEASDAPGADVAVSDVPETVVEEPVAEEPVADLSDAEAAARQALAGGQRDGLVEEAPASVEAPAVEADEAEAVVEVEPEVEAELEVDEAVETSAETELVSGPEADTDAADVEPAAVEELTEVETPAAVVSLPAPSPAADDLVAVATAALAEEAEPVVVVEEPAAEAEVTETEVVAEEPAAETDEPAAEVEPAAVEAEEAAAEAVDTVVVDEPADVEPVAEVAVEEPAVEAEIEAVAEEPAAEELVAEEAVAAEDSVAVEPVAEPVVEEPAAEVEQPTAVTETPAVEAEVEAEPEVEAVAVEVEAPAVEPEVVPEESAEPVAEVEPEPAVEPEAPAVEPEAPAVEPESAARPAKPDFTPGRPVTAYSADELLAVVRWLDGDGVERSDEELLRAAMKELGFARLGPRIKEALGAAVTAARG
ncbi:hypothetical protein GCM10018790_10550 [Kitasatospora xanthocidica]|uniref:hypothetical protein n=1 Tax=Kitasatospora xanthocidica TaxID=83382 RepID=UPI001679C01C|nr:hypothetical protein [Kitasatospora xanthocidica]GHF34733.1 hypothetical protein GCM10018790_10550 [Kitasatospora xanthocidica]